MDYAFKYAEKASIENESDYPYLGVAGSTCNYDPSKG